MARHLALLLLAMPAAACGLDTSGLGEVPGADGGDDGRANVGPVDAFATESGRTPAARPMGPATSR